MSAPLPQPPFWADFPSALTLATLRRPPNHVVDGYLRGLYGAVPSPDCRGVLAWTEAQMRADAGWVTDWLGDVLDLRRADIWDGDLDWRLKKVTGDFFGRFPHRLAFVFAESCRDRVPQQTRAKLTQYGLEASGPARPVTGRPSRPYRLPGVALALPSDTRFVMPRGSRERGMALVPSAFERVLEDERGRLVGCFSGWCAADPWDDRADLLVGRTPAGRETDWGGHLNTGRIACWVRMADERGRRIETLTLDIHPGSGALVSVRETKYPGQFLLKMHPRWHGWLKALFPSGA